MHCWAAQQGLSLFLTSHVIEHTHFNNMDLIQACVSQATSIELAHNLKKGLWAMMAAQLAMLVKGEK